MRRIRTFQSMADHMYKGGPIRLYHYNTYIVLQLPTVFSTLTCYTGL